jgi:hypothetical protein
MVPTIQSYDLYVGEAIAEGLYPSTPRAVSGENCIAAGRNVDLQMAAFCREKDVLLLTPPQRVALTIEDMDKPGFGVLNVTGVAKVSDPDVEICSTHDVVSFLGGEGLWVGR